jgi:neurotransmitter:Na+ symporter, NSS family
LGSIVNSRAKWVTRIGFYFAAIGSAAGLGNLWRFPYIVGENGGGAFVLLYLFLVFTLGLTLLIGELILGKSTGKSVLLATSKLSGTVTLFGHSFVFKNFKWVGRFSLLLSLVVLSYYSVISGWALHFLTLFFASFFQQQEVILPGSMSALMENGWMQSGLVSVHLLFAAIIVLKGIEEGLEKWVGWMMPIFGFLMLILVIKSMYLPSAGEALRFLFYPDFSKLTWSSLIQAIGHVGFTLSIGFGTLVTFGSYLQNREHIPSAGFKVTIVDTIISLVAGLLIFPIAIGASNLPLTDPRLMFEALPPFILNQPGGRLFGLAFFICLYLAALNATIGLFENIVSNWVERKKTGRSKSTWYLAGLLLFLSLIPAFSGSFLKNMRWNNKGTLEILDAILINWMLPLIIMGLSVAIAIGLTSEEKKKYFIDSNHPESASLFSYWHNIVLWFIPGTVLLALILQIIGMIG